LSQGDKLDAVDSGRHLPYSDQVITVSSEQSLTISRPGKRQTLWWISTSRSRNLWSQLLNHVLTLEIPDLDGGSSGGTEPVSVRREDQAVDSISMIQGVQVLAIVEVPEHGLGILATTGTERTIRRHSDSVEITSMANMVGLQLAVGQVPDLDILVPASRHDDWVLVVGREPDAGHPVLVAILLDGVLALSQGVPQLDGLVPGGRDDLSVVSGEGNREDILGMVLEPAGSLSSTEIPQSHGLIPGPRESKVTIRREDNIGDEMSMTVKSLLGNSIVSNVIPGQLPDDERLVS